MKTLSTAPLLLIVSCPCYMKENSVLQILVVQKIQNSCCFCKIKIPETFILCYLFNTKLTQCMVSKKLKKNTWTYVVHSTEYFALINNTDIRVSELIEVDRIVRVQMFPEYIAMPH